MNIPNIDSKVMARAFALAMAVKIRSSILRGNSKYSPNGTILEQAKDFEKYLIGDADLPEVKEDYTKEWIDTLKDTYNKQAKERIEKMDKDWEEFMSTLPETQNINLYNNEANKTSL